MIDFGVFAVAVAVTVGGAILTLFVVTVAENGEAAELFQLMPSPIAVTVNWYPVPGSNPETVPAELNGAIVPPEITVEVSVARYARSV